MQGPRRRAIHLKARWKIRHMRWRRCRIHGYYEQASPAEPWTPICPVLHLASRSISTLLSVCLSVCLPYMSETALDSPLAGRNNAIF